MVRSRSIEYEKLSKITWFDGCWWWKSYSVKPRVLASSAALLCERGCPEGREGCLLGSDLTTRRMRLSLLFCPLHNWINTSTLASLSLLDWSSISTAFCGTRWHDISVTVNNRSLILQGAESIMQGLALGLKMWYNHGIIYFYPID